jgi:hypothetical protein
MLGRTLVAKWSRGKERQGAPLAEVAVAVRDEATGEDELLQALLDVGTSR